ncbi:MAG: hypothetical protein ACREOO_26315 [bacterium]
MKLAYYDSQCQKFQQEHKRNFAEFEASVHASAQKNFEEWEDYMDWEAADSARRELTQRLQELVEWKP